METDPTFRVETRREVMDDAEERYGDLHPNGDRFIAFRTVASTAPDDAERPIRHIVIHNFFTELVRLFENER